MYFCTKYCYTSFHLWYIRNCEKFAIEQNLNYHIITSNFYTAEMSWHMFTNSITINFLSVKPVFINTIQGHCCPLSSIEALFCYFDCLLIVVCRLLTEIRRDQRLSESPLVLRHQDSSQAPEFSEVFEACVSILLSLV